MNISIDSIQRIVKTIPEYLSEYGPKVWRAIKPHLPTIGVGAAAGIIAADDISTRKKLKQERQESEKRDVLVRDTIMKQDAEIRALKEEADNASNLKVVNKELCKVVKHLEDEKEALLDEKNKITPGN